MATILKPRSDSENVEAASTDSETGQPIGSAMPRSDGRAEVRSDGRAHGYAASARVIKTTSLGREYDDTRDSEGADKDSPKNRETQNDALRGMAAKGHAAKGLAGKITGALVGDRSKANAGLAEFNLSDLAEQGRMELQRCRKQVEAMMEEGRLEAEKLKQNAKTQGHREGKQAAASEIEQRIAQEADVKAKARVESLQNAVVQMREQYDAWMQQYADVLTHTAIAVAERLTRSQLTLPNDADERSTRTNQQTATGADSGESSSSEHLIVRWAREALHSTRSASRLTLAVHPDTLATLGKSLDELLAHPDLPEQSVVIPDETLAIGDIVVRQDGGEISAGLDAQLNRLREELT